MPFGCRRVVLDLNGQDRCQLCCPSELAVVRGATQLFEEPCVLAWLADLGRGWFVHHLAAARVTAAQVPAGGCRRGRTSVPGPGSGNHGSFAPAATTRRGAE